MKLQLILISPFLLLGLFQITFQCKCPTTKVCPRTITPASQFQVVPEKIDDTTTSLPVIASTLIHLQYENHINQNILAIKTHPCPDGFRLPTQSEYESLMEYAQTQGGVTYLTNTTGLAMTVNRNYIVSPIIDENFYMALTFNENGTYVFEKRLIKSESTPLYAKCVRGIEESYGIDGDVFVVPNKTEDYEMNTKNIKGILWAVDFQLYNSTEITLSFKEKRCYFIESWMINMADKLIYSCKPIYVQDPTYSEVDTTFDLTKIQTKQTNKLIYGSMNLFQTPGNAPIAPKADGGFYVAYSDFTTNNIHIIEYDGNANELVDKDLNVKGRVIDITATDWGFALIHCSMDLYSEYVSGYFSDYSMRFNTVLFNNGKEPPVLKEQIVFFDTKTNLILNGLNALTHAENGRLLYTNGIFSISFSHQNNFHAGVDSNFTSGDTFITLDSNGENINLAFSFKTLQPLEQSLTFDGKHIVYAALGDQVPENIHVCVIRPDIPAPESERVYYSCNTMMHPAHIPGDAKGNSAGRFGGIVHDGDDFALIYSVRPYKTNTTNEVGIIKFDIDDNIITGVVKNAIPGLNGTDVVQIRGGKYGKNILVMYVIGDASGELPPKDDVVIGKVGFVLVDFDGKVISGPFEKDGSDISVNDDIQELNDGTVVWTSVEKGESGYKLNIHHIKV